MDRSFVKAFLSLLVCASTKKNVKAIEFLGFLKTCFSNNKNINFCLKKKRNVLLSCRLFVYCIIHRCMYSLFMLLLFSYISFSETGHRKSTNPSLFIQKAKVHKMNEKRSCLGVRVLMLNNNWVN